MQNFWIRRSIILIFWKSIFLCLFLDSADRDVSIIKINISISKSQYLLSFWLSRILRIENFLKCIELCSGGYGIKDMRIWSYQKWIVVEIFGILCLQEKLQVCKNQYISIILRKLSKMFLPKVFFKHYIERIY